MPLIFARSSNKPSVSTIGVKEWPVAITLMFCFFSKAFLTALTTSFSLEGWAKLAYLND